MENTVSGCMLLGWMGVVANDESTFEVVKV
jgi:hypothetical protein